MRTIFHGGRRFAHLHENVVQTPSRHQFHGIVVRTFFTPLRINRQNVGVVQFGGRFGFAPKTRDRVVGQPQLIGQNLERDQAIQRNLPSAENHTHSASTDLLENLEVADPLTDERAPRPGAASGCETA